MIAAAVRLLPISFGLAPSECDSGNALVSPGGGRNRGSKGVGGSGRHQLGKLGRSVLADLPVRPFAQISGGAVCRAVAPRHRGCRSLRSRSGHVATVVSSRSVVIGTVGLVADPSGTGFRGSEHAELASARPSELEQRRQPLAPGSPSGALSVAGQLHLESHLP